MSRSTTNGHFDEHRGADIGKDGESESDLLQTGLKAIDAELRKLAAIEEPVCCREIGAVIDAAIEYGVPVYNGGSHVGCAELYLHCARGIVETVSPRKVTPGGDTFLSMAREACQTAEDNLPAQANAVAWHLRELFDKFHVFRGIETVDWLCDQLLAGGTAAGHAGVSAVLSTAIAHGNVLYQAEQLPACAILHVHTARAVLKLIDIADSPADAVFVRQTRSLLVPLLRQGDKVTRENATELAWQFYKAFLKIVNLEGSGHAGFISYRREGGFDVAQSIHSRLLLRGVSTFLDVASLDSGRFSDQLLSEIEQSPNFVVILTPGCLSRCHDPHDWVRREIVHAINYQRTIIPLLAPDFEFPAAEELPRELQPLHVYQGVRISREYFDATIDKLIRYMHVEAQP